MNLLKPVFYFLLMVFFVLKTHSQQGNFPKLSIQEEIKIDSISKINFLDYPYKYINKNFKINISEKEFEKAYLKYPRRIKNYKDSISLLTMYEFNDWTASRIATHRITYTWKRLGYYTWKTANEAKMFAKVYNINHPYKMYKFLINPKNKQPKIIDFFYELSHNLNQPINNNFTFINREKLLKKAFKNNPKRLEYVEKFHKKTHLNSKKNRQKRDSIKKLNLLTKKYSFLNENYKITLSSSEFDTITNNLLKKYYFPKSTIKTYTDSLNIIVPYKIKDKLVARELIKQILKEIKK